MPVRGFLLKSDAARELISAVEELRHGRTYFTPTVSTKILEGYVSSAGTKANTLAPQETLTPREREVVQLIAEGRSSKEVAVALGMSVKTAETHRSNILRKLNLHSTSELVMYAVRNNIVQVVQPVQR